MCSGKRVRGKTTTCSGNSGSSRVDMLPLLRLRPVPAILSRECKRAGAMRIDGKVVLITGASEGIGAARSEEHTSELQSLRHLVCRLLLEKKKQKKTLSSVCVSLGRVSSVRSSVAQA